MDTIIFIIGIIVFIVSFFVALCYNIHIYQLNYYKDNVQLKWIMKNITKILKNNILLFIAIPLLLLGNAGRIAGIIILVLITLINREKDVKKPLVYTNRVKRLIITSFIVSLGIVFAVSIISKNIDMSFITIYILQFFVPIIMLFANVLNKPINYAINSYYINDAKKMINEMPNLVVIGVTGSYGKTSVKNFLNKFLSTKYNVLITPENYNTTLGVVKTIRNNLKATHDIFICEMGATKLGDIKEICDIVKPKYGVITSIGPQHLESFGKIENVIKTKFELVNSLPKDGVAFLNYDNEYITGQKIEKSVIKYGVKYNDVEFKVFDIKSTNKGLEFSIKDKEENIIDFSTKLIGNHNVENIIGAMTIANYFGVSLKEMVSKVRQLECVPHRLELIRNNNNIIIDDAYNSNPNGAKSALETLNTFNGIKILVTPGMIELGDKEYECNYELGVLASKICDYIVLVGKEQTKPIYEGVISTNYDNEKLIVVDRLSEALNEVEKIQSNELPKIVLLENDLPDNY